MKRFIAAILAGTMMMLSAQMQTDVTAEFLISIQFDFGGLGTADGYTGVSAADGYDSAKGYGFENTDAVENVPASGKGTLADAVRFKSDVPNHIFSVDLPKGVYKITVTTGDVQSTTITAEHIPQLFFLTGSNASDSFTIPVTDGQLNIYAGSGVGTEFSISTLEIEQTSTGTETKPTIWVSGDSTVASYYNVPDDAMRGWGQYLGNYIDAEKYEVRNISANGITSADLRRSLFATAESYGKAGDILLLAVGINDYAKEYGQHPDAPDPSDYIANLTDMIRRAKAKGMTVYLVKQHGQLSDLSKYPLPAYKWFGKALEQTSESEQTGVIDLFRPWLEFSLENAYFAQKTYYTADGLHLNARNILVRQFSHAEKRLPVYHINLLIWCQFHFVSLLNTSLFIRLRSTAFSFPSPSKSPERQSASSVSRSVSSHFCSRITSARLKLPSALQSPFGRN